MLGDFDRCIYGTFHSNGESSDLVPYFSICTVEYVQRLQRLPQYSHGSRQYAKAMCLLCWREKKWERERERECTDFILLWLRCAQELRLKFHMNMVQRVVHSDYIHSITMNGQIEKMVCCRLVSSFVMPFKCLENGSHQVFELWFHAHSRLNWKRNEFGMGADGFDWLASVSARIRDKLQMFGTNPRICRWCNEFATNARIDSRRTPKKKFINGNAADAVHSKSYKNLINVSIVASFGTCAGWKRNGSSDAVANISFYWYFKHKLWMPFKHQT